MAENVFLNRQQTSGPFISWKTMRAEAQQLVDAWDIGVDVRRTADVLTVEQRQMVEIARALSFGARFIILDEPTAQLDPRGVGRLFDRLRDLQAQGVSFLYISHHLEEIYEICQTVTVFRDARHIVTAPVADLTSDDLVAAMTGESGLLAAADQASTVRGGDPVLVLDHLSGEGFYDVSLTVRPGEVVGITGSGSSGQDRPGRNGGRPAEGEEPARSRSPARRRSRATSRARSPPVSASCHAIGTTRVSSRV